MDCAGAPVDDEPSHQPADWGCLARKRVVLVLLLGIRDVDRDRALLLLSQLLAPSQCSLLGVEAGPAEPRAEVWAASNDAPAAPVDVDR